MTIWSQNTRKISRACYIYLRIIFLSDSEWIEIYNHLDRKRTLNHLAKLVKWLNGWVLVYKLSGCEFESCCRHLNFRYHACFEQGVPRYPGNYRV